MDRLASLRGDFDIVVVGGGIVGAGVARDAAMRGLSVALVERADYGSGTTAGSTRLIHGGLRYLEMLDFRLVRLDLRERETLLAIAPHLVKPLEFLLPFHGRGTFYRGRLRAGMLLYDALSFDKSLPRHRFLSAAEVRRAEPALETRGLQGAASYWDAQVDSPERLCLENVLDARARGAAALNYAEVEGAIHQAGRVAGVRVRDTLEGGSAEVRARVVVNASGPWFDRVAARLAPPHPRRLLRTTKGIHLACAPVARRAVVLFSRQDGRLFFGIPWQGYTWLGTTDTDFTEDPALARATPEDARYLLDSAAPYFPALAQGEPYWSNAGVRALVTRSGDESSISRQHRIGTEIPGLVSVLGGKLTGYRAIAEDAVDAACAQLGAARRPATAETPLPGATSQPPADHLDKLYGARAAEIRRLAESDPALAARLAPDYPDIAAQAVFAARHEECARLSDFLLRRTFLGFARDQGMAALEPAAAVLSAELGWSAARRGEEIANYRQWVRESRAFAALR
jgi:glycerol-3-phosphate dehydrogenase